MHLLHQLVLYLPVAVLLLLSLRHVPLWKQMRVSQLILDLRSSDNHWSGVLRAACAAESVLQQENRQRLSKKEKLRTGGDADQLQDQFT